MYTKEGQNILKEYKVKSFDELTESNWNYISSHQKLSEEFIEKFSDKVYWNYISQYQKLSEKFIKKYENKVNWDRISYSQKLSEKFIEKYENKVNWGWISYNQKLSEKFIQKYSDKINIEIQEKNFQEKTLEEKLKEIKEYAKEHKLEFKNNKLIAYRNHDMHNRGVFNKTISYTKGKYYKDWRCNMNKEDENSFGLGIFPKGNTKVEIKVEDWGVAVGRKDGKARVFGFKVLTS